MDHRMSNHHAKPTTVRLTQWHRNEHPIKQCEQSSQLISDDNSLLNRTFVADVKNYLKNGILLLDIEESDLENITIRVAEQMIYDGATESFDIRNVSNVFLLTQQKMLEGSSRSEEHELQKDISFNATEIIDLDKLMRIEDINAVTVHPKANQPSVEATLVMVANANFIQKPTLSFVRLKTPVHFPETFDLESAVRLLLVLLVPATKEVLNYLNEGTTLWTISCNEEFRHIAYNAETKEELIRGIEKVYANQHIELNQHKDHGDEERVNLLRQQYPPLNPLLKTDRLWGGLINDVTRRLPQYKSDIFDGLNRQVFAASIFLYFGVLSTAITFGGLMSSKTHNLMGISETLLSTSLVGIAFHLLSSQPLVIVGGTGPLLLFDEALFQLCEFYEFNFLTVRIYIGIWLGMIAVTIASFDGCVYLRLLTRFTQELFASLISLIFMMEAAFKVIEVFKTHLLSPPLPENSLYESADVINATSISNTQQIMYEPNTALFCAILSVGTFVLAYCLRGFRNSHFLGRSIRRAIGDFGVPISISVFVYVSYLVPQIYTEKLIVPEGLSPTNPNVRSWLIPFNALPIWVPFVSAIAALLVYVLIFMETQISELILHSRGLKKGSGFHVDIVIICLVNVICGFLGMPWQSGATIRSVTHISAVTTIPERSVESGESQQLIVKEQRVSGLIISVLVGLSVIMAPILRIIPVSILYGVFFYMGIVSISGVQFLHRVRLLLTPTKYHGSEAYVQRVPTWKMHIFTSVQILALGVLWLVKSSRFSLALPFVLLLMIPLKHKLTTYFTATEMAALDGTLQEVDGKDEPDFYEQSHLTA